MVKIQVLCPKCQKSYDVHEAYVGKRAHCKKCDTRFVVSQAEADTSPPPAEWQSQPCRGRFGEINLNDLFNALFVGILLTKQSFLGSYVVSMLRDRLSSERSSRTRVNILQ